MTLASTHLSRCDSRVTVTLWARDIGRDVRRESRSPVPTRPDPAPIKTRGYVCMHRYFCSARVRADACRGATR